MDFSKINDNWLIKDLKLETNLAKVCGKFLYKLSGSLNQLSMRKANKSIIELIIYQHPTVFNNSRLIQEVMSDRDPVFKAFTVLGIKDMNCNVKWLIHTLNQLDELGPLRHILYTAIPQITLIYPSQGTTIEPGETIIFGIRTVSHAKIQWCQDSNENVKVLYDNIQINEWSSVKISFKTKESDNAKFFIRVYCNGSIVVPSQSISTVNYKPTKSLSSRSVSDENHQDMQTCPCTDLNKQIRVALLIGMMNYTRNKLYASESDISKLKDVLLSIGFTVYCFVDLNTSEIEHILKVFSDYCIKDNSFVFFYYSGHGKIENKIDNLVLIDSKIFSIGNLINKLQLNKPKVLVTIFDMCRSNYSNKKPEEEDYTVNVKIPTAANLIVVNSTLPLKEAYEKKIHNLEFNSLIIEQLCDNLIKFACTDPINSLLIKFINECKDIKQKGTISCTAVREVIGIKNRIPSFNPTFEWVKKPENSDIMNCVVVNFRVFYNRLCILLIHNEDPEVSKSMKIINAQGEAAKLESTVEGSRYIIDLLKIKNPEKTNEFKINMEYNNISIQIKVYLPEHVMQFLG